MQRVRGLAPLALLCFVATSGCSAYRGPVPILVQRAPYVPPMPASNAVGAGITLPATQSLPAPVLQPNTVYPGVPAPLPARPALVPVSAPVLVSVPVTAPVGSAPVPQMPPKPAPLVGAVPKSNVSQNSPEAFYDPVILKTFLKKFPEIPEKAFGEYMKQNEAKFQIIRDSLGNDWGKEKKFWNCESVAAGKTDEIWKCLSSFLEFKRLPSLRESKEAFNLDLINFVLFAAQKDTELQRNMSYLYDFAQEEGVDGGKMENYITSHSKLLSKMNDVMNSKTVIDEMAKRAQDNPDSEKEALAKRASVEELLAKETTLAGASSRVLASWILFLWEKEAREEPVQSYAALMQDAAEIARNF